MLEGLSDCRFLSLVLNGCQGGTLHVYTADTRVAIAELMIDPSLESLSDDPEFKAIVKQAQDEKAVLRAQVREMEERGELDL